MEKYILLGGGGFAIELYEYMKADGIEIAGYYAQDNNLELSEWIPWLGDIDTVAVEKMDKTAQYIVAVRLLRYREKMISFIEEAKLKAGSFISSRAYYSTFAQIGKGAVIFPNAMVTGNPRVGDYLFMDAQSIISHGDVMGNNIVIGPAVIITGDCMIGDNVTFGVNSAILPGTKIGSNTEIAINTYPQRNVAANSCILSKPGKNFGKGINKNFKK